jgi:hypothetical protein
MAKKRSVSGLMMARFHLEKALNNCTSASAMALAMVNWLMTTIICGP